MLPHHLTATQPHRQAERERERWLVWEKGLGEVRSGMLLKHS
jgi:hypothetical protein